jgi:hypothetical protein
MDLYTERDFFMTDLSYSIPKLFLDALKTKQSDIVRGVFRHIEHQVAGCEPLGTPG